MKHKWSWVPVRYIQLAILALFFNASIVGVHAVDDDYFIPYTDKQGYVYDAKTGQFIKQKSPAKSAAVATTSTPTAATIQSVTGLTVPSQPSPAVVSESANNQQTGRNAGILSGLIIVAVTVYFLLSRRKRVTTNH